MSWQGLSRDLEWEPFTGSQHRHSDTEDAGRGVTFSLGRGRTSDGYFYLKILSLDDVREILKKYILYKNNFCLNLEKLYNIITKNQLKREKIDFLEF